MKIVVAHLTRMHGGHICVAGIDVQTRRHVRPIMEHEGMPCEHLARYGGPFDMARIVELGKPRTKPDKPHVEDVVFVPSWAKVERTAGAAEFWALLGELSETRLRAIFGDPIRQVGQSQCGTDEGQGLVSLGCLRPDRPPQLYLQTRAGGKPKIRMKISDGQFEADVGVTDLRLYQADHATPDPKMVHAATRWIADSQEIILAVGLTRKYRSDDGQDYVHWLQVNNIHLREDPAWPLR